MDEYQEYHITIDVNNKEKRLDKCLSTYISHLSRSRLQSLITDGHIYKKGIAITSCRHKVQEGDIYHIIIPPPLPTIMKPTAIPLTILYEDEDLLVIDKQAGLTVHPGAGNPDHTMANALLELLGPNLSSVGGVLRPGIVHRLDKDTSGLIMVAKNDQAHLSLSHDIAHKHVQRRYYAFCWGVPKPHQGSMTGHIGRSPNNRKKMAVLAKGGKYACTHYQVQSIYQGGLISQLSCQLETGRTHQIRVHCAYHGYPLLGDPLYSRQRKRCLSGLDTVAQDMVRHFPRQALHAYQLVFTHPSSGKELHFTSSLPNDLLELKNHLSQTTSL